MTSFIEILCVCKSYGKWGKAEPSIYILQTQHLDSPEMTEQVFYFVKDLYLCMQNSKIRKFSRTAYTLMSMFLRVVNRNPIKTS